MPTKKQHFVPRVYMKAWETQVETHKEPDKKFNGIYVIKDGSTGDGANRNSVLWKPHLYTINFKYSFICFWYLFLFYLFIVYYLLIICLLLAYYLLLIS